MWKILKKYFEKPIKPDDVIAFTYTDKKGEITNRFVLVKEVHPTYILTYDYNKMYWRSFNQVRMENVVHPNWKTIRKNAKQIAKSMDLKYEEEAA